MNFFKICQSLKLLFLHVIVISYRYWYSFHFSQRADPESGYQPRTVSFQFKNPGARIKTLRTTLVSVLSFLRPSRNRTLSVPGLPWKPGPCRWRRAGSRAHSVASTSAPSPGSSSSGAGPLIPEEKDDRLANLLTQEN